MSDLTYWAALPPDELGKRAMDKVRAFRRWFSSTGYASKALKGWRMANGWTDAGETSSRLQAGGERQQLVKAVINGLRPLRQRFGENFRSDDVGADGNDLPSECRRRRSGVAAGADKHVLREG